MHRTIPHAFAVLTLLFAHQARAQDAQAGQADPAAEAIRQAEKRPPTITLLTSGTYNDSADLDDGPGDFSVTRIRALLEVGFDLGERRNLSVGLGAERSWYDFKNATDLVAGGDPFGRVTDTELYVRYNAPLNDTTSWFALAAIGIAAEDGADISDSLIYSGSLGFVTKASDNFSWGLGVLVRSQLEDDALIIPIPQIRWAINDRWTLESQRAGIRLDYAHSDRLSYGLQGEYASRSYRLRDDGPLPDGMATDRRVPVSFYANYKATDSITIGASVGASFFGEIELLDDNGNTTAKDDFDPAPFIGLSARIVF